MGFISNVLDLFRRPEPKRIETAAVEPKKERNTPTGSKDDYDTSPYYQAYNNQNITFGGELKGYDYDAILRNKQANIYELFRLADYYVDADPIVHGIVHHVYLPYTLSTPYVLRNANEKTKKIYEAYYQKIRLREKLDSIAYELWKYNNVIVYIHDGIPVTLPILKCKIGNVSFCGEPLVDFDCQGILNEWRQKNYDIRENWVKDNNLETYFEGYPPEVQEAINLGHQWAQLNPKYTKVLQGSKEGWTRWAIPFIAACLPALARKELIGTWEASLLDLGIHSFVHTKYGDPKEGQDMYPDNGQLSELRGIISKAMSGFPLAVTNHLVENNVVQPKMEDLFQFDKYRDVNNEILSAGGVSGILVSGISVDGSTFATAQVSMQTAGVRIEAARDEICELMNKINVCIKEKLEESHVYNVSTVPTFAFMPLDMAGRKALRETAEKLWQTGVLSTKTLLDLEGYSIDREKTQRETEAREGYDDALKARALSGQVSSDDVSSDGTSDEGGRPAMTVEERSSDPEAARRGAQPKPSNPDGSGGGEEPID